MTRKAKQNVQVLQKNIDIYQSNKFCNKNANFKIGRNICKAYFRKWLRCLIYESS